MFMVGFICDRLFDANGYSCAGKMTKDLSIACLGSKEGKAFLLVGFARVLMHVVNRRQEGELLFNVGARSVTAGACLILLAAGRNS